MQAKLAAFRKSGAISGDDYTLFSGKIAQMRSEVDKGSSAMHGFSLNTAASRRELGYITKDLATGQYGRMSQSLSTLAVRSNALSLVMSPLGAGIAAVAATVGLFVVAAIKGAAETEKLRTTLIAVGDSAGVSVGALNGMAVAVGESTGKYGDARKAIELLAASGKEAGAGLGGLAQQAVDMSIVTGESVDKSVAKIIELGQKPSETIAALNDQYHFLTAAQYAQIAALEAEGKVREAARLANSLDAQAMADRAKDVENNANWMVRSAHAVSKAWGAAWTAMKGGDSQGPMADAAKALQDQIDKLTQGHQLGKEWIPGISKDDPRVQKLEAALADVRRQQYDAGLKDVNDQLNAKANADAIAAQRATSQFDAPDVKRDNAIAIASKHMADQLGVNGLTEDDKARIRTRYANEVTAANESFNSAMNKGVKKDKKAPDLSINPPPDFLSSITDGYQKELDAQAKATIALEDYRQVQEAKLRTSQEALDLQVKSIGMGDREIAMEREIISIHREADQDLQRLNKQRSSMTQDQYDARLAVIKEFEDRRVAAAHDADDRIRAAQSQWQNGFTRAFDNYVDQAGDVAG